jgi:hypothetical protein
MRRLVHICAGFAVLGCAARAQTRAPVERREVEVVRAERAQQRAQAQVERQRVRVEREAQRAQRQAVVMRERSLNRARMDSIAANRATLGVTLGGSGSKRDTLGIFVTSVAENGPAERAGIYEGDRIAVINGVDLRTQASDAGDSYLAGVARRRLMREMEKLTPGSRATLRVWSGGRYKEVPVTTARQSDVYRGRRVGFSFGDNMFVGMPGMDRVIQIAPAPGMLHFELPEPPEPPEPLDPPEPPDAPAPPAPPERGPSSSGEDLREGTIEIDVDSILDHAWETLRSLKSEGVGNGG